LGLELAVRVISRRRLREFWEQPGHNDANELLTAWHKVVKRADWTKFADIKATFGSADLVGSCLVFDIGNNRYRLIARAIFKTHCVYVLRVMTHKEYDKKRWIKQCGCYEPPPKRRNNS
jgi:mRNA interferase HigB